MSKKTHQKVFTPALKKVQKGLLKYLEASCYLVSSHDGYWGRGDTIDQGARTCGQTGRITVRLSLRPPDPGR